MLVREYEKKITKFSKRNVVDISNPCDTKKAPCKNQQVDVFFKKEAPVIKRSVYTKLWSVAKSGSGLWRLIFYSLLLLLLRR